MLFPSSRSTSLTVVDPTSIPSLTIFPFFFIILWADRKPGSVFDDHPSRTAVACSLMRHTLGRVRAAPLVAHFVLLRMGFTRQLCLHSPGELLPHHFNLTTALPVSAECFCCTFPMVTHGGCYPSSLPYGARTFLIPEGTRPSGLPLYLTIYLTAIHSISTMPSLGSLATSTQERAGLCSPKYSA